jgi:hypothetical protein
MNILSFLNMKKESDNAATTMLPVINESEHEDSANSQDNEVKESKKITLSVSYATGWPIDIIYGYLHKNYEEQGFNDAMVKSDLNFRDMNMSIIRNKILMVFREINLNYDVIRRDFETRINTCNAAGLLTTISELEKQKAIIDAHKVELAQLEKDFRNNDNEASVPLQSYECGFLRGIATIAMSTPQQSNSYASVNVDMVSQKKATA